MPRVDLVVRSSAPISPRAELVMSSFDVPRQRGDVAREWHAELPLDDRDWNVGLIVGPSGSGKSQVLNAVFGQPPVYDWPREACVVDGFPDGASIEQITSACSSVGFNTIPSWLTPFSVLSCGEQFRVNMARLMVENAQLTVVDEFTSVVDRQIAKIASSAVAKYFRKNNRRFIAASCHYDIIDWLQPDWTFEPATCAFAWRSLQRRPQIDAEIRRVEWNTWNTFAPYHYLTADLHRAAKCYAVVVDGRPVSFAGLLKRPGRKRGNNLWGVSRLVTLPDWQGLGIAMILVDAIGAALSSVGQRLRTYPAHYSLIRSFFKSKKWRVIQKPVSGMRAWGSNAVLGKSTDGVSRQCAIFEYCGSTIENHGWL